MPSLAKITEGAGGILVSLSGARGRSLIDESVSQGTEKTAQEAKDRGGTLVMDIGFC